MFNLHRHGRWCSTHTTGGRDAVRIGPFRPCARSNSPTLAFSVLRQTGTSMQQSGAFAEEEPVLGFS
ncbi:MAG: hypothetical protein QGF03_05655, partial [SAR324 cluster bacterium]|nr:hypothetical protein [SAR324 cluster bacterium]